MESAPPLLVAALPVQTAPLVGAQGLGIESLDFAARAQLDTSAHSGVITRRGDPPRASPVRRADASAQWRVSPQWRAAATLAHEEGKLVLDTAAVGWLPREGLELRVGRIDPDFGLGNANSSSWTACIERSAVWDLVPGMADATAGFGARAVGHVRGWHASAGVYDKCDYQSLVARGVWRRHRRW